jgi:hypothetical protein
MFPTRHFQAASFMNAELRLMHPRSSERWRWCSSERKLTFQTNIAPYSLSKSKPNKWQPEADDNLSYASCSCLVSSSIFKVQTIHSSETSGFFQHASTSTTQPTFKLLTLKMRTTVLSNELAEANTFRIVFHWNSYRLLLYHCSKTKKTKFHGQSPRGNYTDRATAACRRSVTNFCG